MLVTPKLLPRKQLITKLRENPRWDIIIVGGGATGLGAAVDAASRGYRTLLLEAHDFSQGTSSRSTKLLHGGVRYLAQMNFSLVREALEERGRVLRNAPKALVNPIGFIIPAYHWLHLPFYAAGLKLYDALAKKHGLPSSRILSRSETLHFAPTLAIADGAGHNLKGGVLYFDGQFDDARLAISLMRTVFAHDGLALNYCPVTRLIKQDDKVTGVTAKDGETGEIFHLYAGAVINATGVWVDLLRSQDNPLSSPMISPSQGAHIVLDRDFLPGDHAILVPKTADGRVLFCIPWLGKVLVGTTDTMRSDLALDPDPFVHEIDFILETLGQILTRKPTRHDIRAQFAGLRPLVKATKKIPTSQLSREHTIILSPSNLITVTGGKWTTYRKMAEEVIDQAIVTAKLQHAVSVTSTLLLEALEYSAVASPQLHQDFPYTEEDVRNAYLYELARQADDILMRRSRIGMLDETVAKVIRPRIEALLQALRNTESD